jgi:hypothetical protein
LAFVARFGSLEAARERKKPQLEPTAILWGAKKGERRPATKKPKGTKRGLQGSPAGRLRDGVGSSDPPTKKVIEGTEQRHLKLEKTIFFAKAAWSPRCPRPLPVAPTMMAARILLFSYVGHNVCGASLFIACLLNQTNPQREKERER